MSVLGGMHLHRFELTVGAKKVEAYMIWSKSVMHPKIPDLSGDDDAFLCASAAAHLRSISRGVQFS